MADEFPIYPTRKQIDDWVIVTMIEHGPDGHCDGHDLITDFIVARIAAVIRDKDVQGRD